LRLDNNVSLVVDIKISQTPATDVVEFAGFFNIPFGHVLALFITSPDLSLVKRGNLILLFLVRGGRVGLLLFIR
jgi:hypothetical protein